MFCCPGLSGQNRLTQLRGLFYQAFREICIHHILLQHALRIEEGAIQGDGGAHNAPPLLRLLIIEREQHVFQVVVQRACLRRLIFVVLDGPSGDAFNPAFNPPSIENAEAGDAVQGRLHTAGAGRLIRALGRVQPNVYAADQMGGNLPLIIFQIDNAQRIIAELMRQLNYAADLLFSGAVGRVCLAAVDDLHGAVFARAAGKAFRVGKEQVGAFVSGGATGKANGEDAGVKADACAFGNQVHEPLFGLRVRVLDFLFRNINGVTQGNVVLPPARHMAVKDGLESRRGPGDCVDAVGDGGNLVFRKHRAGNFAVLHGHTIHKAGEGERYVGHVQEAIVDATALLQERSNLVPEDARGLLLREAVVSCRHGGVRGEDAFLADGGHIVFTRRVQRSAAKLVLHQGNGQQRRVALIHVVNGCTKSKRMEQPHAANAEKGLLAKAVVAIAAVKMVCEGAVAGIILLEVRIQKIDRDDVPGDALYIVTPCAHGDPAAFECDSNDRFFRNEFLFRLPRLLGLGLHAVRVKMLAEIAFAVGQSDSGQVQAGISGRAKSVSGKHAQTAAVRRHAGRYGNLHGKISDSRIARRMKRRKRKTHSGATPHTKMYGIYIFFLHRDGLKRFYQGPCVVFMKNRPHYQVGTLRWQPKELLSRVYMNHFVHGQCGHSKLIAALQGLLHDPEIAKSRSFIAALLRITTYSWYGANC